MIWNVFIKQMFAISKKNSEITHHKSCYLIPGSELITSPLSFITNESKQILGLPVQTKFVCRALSRATSNTAAKCGDARRHLSRQPCAEEPHPLHLPVGKKNQISKHFSQQKGDLCILRHPHASKN